MPPRRSAFTLIEAQITLFLFFIVLLVFASLGREYRRITRFADARQNAMQAWLVGLEGIGRELRGAVTILSPAAVGSGASSLRFQRVDPNRLDRLEPTPVPPRTPVRDVQDAPYLLTLEYSVSAEQLRRRVSDGSGTLVSDMAVAHRVQGFSVTWNADHTATLLLTVQADKRLETLSQKVLLPEGR